MVLCVSLSSLHGTMQNAGRGDAASGASSELEREGIREELGIGAQSFVPVGIPG